MTELEQLREQRREINRRIATLKESAILSVGRAKLNRSKGCYQDWYVSVLTRGHTTSYLTKGIVDRYCRVITVEDKNDIIKILPEIVRDLQALYEVMKQEKVSEMNAKEGEHDDRPRKGYQ